MNKLVERKINEANYHLDQFQKAYHSHGMFLGGTIVVGLASPVLLLIQWAIGQVDLLSAVALCLLLVMVGCAASFYWKSRAKSEFRKVGACVFDIEESGFIVYKREAGLRTVFAVAERAETAEHQQIKCSEHSVSSFYHEFS